MKNPHEEENCYVDEIRRRLGRPLTQNECYEVADLYRQGRPVEDAIIELETA
jgi:hypothetical protein